MREITFHTRFPPVCFLPPAGAASELGQQRELRASDRSNSEMMSCPSGSPPGGGFDASPGPSGGSSSKWLVTLDLLTGARAHDRPSPRGRTRAAHWAWGGMARSGLGGEGHGHIKGQWWVVGTHGHVKGMKRAEQGFLGSPGGSHLAGDPAKTCRQKNHRLRSELSRLHSV